jgi:3-oxoadipate enol-lactonase
MSAAYLPTYQTRGSGPALVFLHGIGGNRHSFDDQLPAFADRWQAIAWDMPGYGGSPLPQDGLSFPMMADALASLLDQLGIDRAGIVGHSMGGMVAQQFAVQHADRVNALVLSATSPAFGKPGGDWQKQFLAERLKPLDDGKTPADFAEKLVTGMFADPADAAGIARAATTMAALPAATYRAALECIVTFDRREQLPQIGCPTLCLAASEDTTAPPKVLERMAEKIPNAVYRCLPGLGHLANVEGAQAFNAAVREFLSSVDAG